MRWSLAPLGALFVACGGHSKPANACDSHSSPAFKVGLSAEDGTYLSDLVDGAMVKMHPGPQGGCHLWIAFRTEGFAQGATVSYKLTDHDANEEQIISMSDIALDLSPDPTAVGMCEAGAFKAFMLKATTRENHHVKLDVTITDVGGATASKSIDNILALWADPVAGIDRQYWCGPN
jgi:hypothetical protein